MDPLQDNPQATAGSSGSTEQSSLTDVMNRAFPSQPKAEPSAGGDKDAGTKGGATTSQQDLPSWMQQLDGDIRANVEQVKQLSKFQKIGDLAKSYSALEQKLGRSVVQPDKDATPEEIQAFYEKLGKPKEAAKYGIDDKDADSFKALAFRHNLTDEQAKGVWSELKGAAQGELERQRADMAQRVKDVDAKLHQEYGSRYGEKMSLLERGIRTFAGAEVGARLRETGLLFDEGIVKMFIQLGELSSEGGTYVKGSAGGKRYKSTADGGSFEFSGLKTS